jgi:hypothetical protein
MPSVCGPLLSEAQSSADSVGIALRRATGTGSETSQDTACRSYRPIKLITAVSTGGRCRLHDRQLNRSNYGPEELARSH